MNRKIALSFLSGLTSDCEVAEKLFLGPLCSDGKQYLQAQDADQRGLLIKEKDEVKVHLNKRGRFDFYGSLSVFLFKKPAVREVN